MSHPPSLEAARRIQVPRLDMQPGYQDCAASLLRVCICGRQVSVQQKLSLLRLLLQHERERLQTWARPLEAHASQQSIAASAWQQYAETAWTIDPRMALALLDRHALSLMLDCCSMIARKRAFSFLYPPYQTTSCSAAYFKQLVRCF